MTGVDEGYPRCACWLHSDSLPLHDSAGPGVESPCTAGTPAETVTPCEAHRLETIACRGARDRSSQRAPWRSRQLPPG